MVAFSLKNEQRQHLKVLREKSSDSVVDLCKLALDYLANGPNEKKYDVASKKLNITTEAILLAVEALVCLLIDATKVNVTESEFGQLKTSGFSDEHISILWQFVSSKRIFIENILKSTSVKEYRFRDLDWRLEGKIASRSLLHQSVPIITIKFYLDSEQTSENRLILKDPNDEKMKQDKELITKREVIVETDPNNLIYLINILEQALLESKTHRTRNILKAL